MNKFLNFAPLGNRIGFNRNFFLLFTGLVILAFNFAFGMPDHEKERTAHFLEALAGVEPEQREETLQELSNKFPEILNGSSLKDTLNTLKSRILESGDRPLYQLLHRAIRNYDSLMPHETADPVTLFYSHYQPPSFSIPHIDLTLDIRESLVKVTSKLSIQRNNHESKLILDGRDHRVRRVLINEKELLRTAYKVTSHELILLEIPEDHAFTVTIESEIDPFNNTSLQGLYQCDQWLITQCESEGARRIFFTLDRPDNLSTITTTIIADKEKYPYRLSNGDLIDEKVLPDQRTAITWNDPIPKPSYLFAAVLGDFAVLKDEFVTRSGQTVDLQVYVEAGKESRARYSLFALKKAMEFDELFFDREYDLTCLKMVGVPNFNAGAMENKGLIIFNDTALLVDAHSGQDADFRFVAHVVAHEYFHNWSGNRVTVRNWFELALKEAFTDSRATQFNEWLFGAEFIRPKDVEALWIQQFPMENNEYGHPLIVESYVTTDSIYDATTYVKGREVFRTLQTYLDMLVPNGFREAQNLYFSLNDGKAVTFKELLAAADVVLNKVGRDSTQFERWFRQQGTPVIQIKMQYDPEKKEAEFAVFQSCPHPKTGQEQEPLPIPFSLEILAKDGTVLVPIKNYILTDKKTVITIPAQEAGVPVFMHGYSAPVILNYDYTPDDYATIVRYAKDPFIRWKAGRDYLISIFKNALENDAGQKSFNAELYAEILRDPDLNLLAKAQLLQFPSIKWISQALNDYDFLKLDALKSRFIRSVALTCKPELERLLAENPEPARDAFDSKDMQVRELRNACLSLLAQVDLDHLEKVYENYLSASNFTTSLAAFNTLLNVKNPHREEVIRDFYQRWHLDKAVFNNWLNSLASSARCSVDDLRNMESADGFDSKNPNHIRSIVRTFISNLSCFHDPKGEGYRYVVDKILEVDRFNPLLAYNYLAVPAFVDFEKLPAAQRALMAAQIERLLDPSAGAQLRDMARKLLAHD